MHTMHLTFYSFLAEKKLPLYNASWWRVLKCNPNVSPPVVINQSQYFPMLTFHAQHQQAFRPGECVYVFRRVMLLQPKTRIIIFVNNSPNAMQFDAMYHRCNLSLWYWIINTHYSTCGCNWIFAQQLLMFSMLSKHGQKRKREKKTDWKNNPYHKCMCKRKTVDCTQAGDTSQSFSIENQKSFPTPTYFQPLHSFRVYQPKLCLP